jgi:hypothetical protein
MDEERTALFSCNGKSIEVPLSFDGERESTSVEIDGVSYHFERIHCSLLSSEYRIDNDPDYQPQTDKDGFCYMIAPFSK